jgi:hypothetical protein
MGFAVTPLSVNSGSLTRFLEAGEEVSKYYAGNQIEKNEMGGARSMYEKKESCIQDFGGET